MKTTADKMTLDQIRQAAKEFGCVVVDAEELCDIDCLGYLAKLCRELGAYDVKAAEAEGD